MLSEKGAIHSDMVQTIIGVISQSVEPLHEKLNGALKELSSEELFNELMSNPDFSMAPILEVLNIYFAPYSNLKTVTLNTFSIMFAFISDKFDQLCQSSQLALIVSLTSCMKYCQDMYDRNAVRADEVEMLKEVIVKTTQSHRNIFKLSLKCQSVNNLKLFAERRTFVKLSDVTFMCREFLRMYESIDIIADSHLVYMKLVLELVRKNSDSNFPSALITYIQIFTRRFMKYPNYKDTLSGLGIAFEAISVGNNANNALNAEMSLQFKKLTADLYNFLVDHSEIIEALAENNLFHGCDIDFFRNANLEKNLNVVAAFKLSGRKYLENEQAGTLLADNHDSAILFESLIRAFYGDCSEINASDLPLSNENELIEYEVFSKLASNNSTESIIELLLRVWSQGHFVSDSRHQIKFMHLLKLSLLSCTSTELGEVLKFRVNYSGPLTVSSLCLVSCFPFSLWHTLEKSQVVSTLVSTLITTWKYLNRNESSIDLLSLVLNAISNLICEAIDLIKSEDLKQIIAFLPVTLSILRNNTSMSEIMKHKLAVSMQKLLRGLLMLRDDKVFDIIDHIVKLGFTESCLTMFDSWKSLSLFSLTKHSRDTPKLNKSVSERIDMLVPKLLSFAENLSPSTKLMIQHYYRHALNLYMRYTSDINFFNNPIIKGEADALLKYIQDSSEPWSKGVFDNSAEESIWKFIYSNILSYKQIDSHTALPVQISSSLKPSLSSTSTLNYLKDDFIALQRTIDDMKSRRDLSALQNLHNGLQALLKLK